MSHETIVAIAWLIGVPFGVSTLVGAILIWRGTRPYEGPHPSELIQGDQIVDATHSTQRRSL